MAAKAPAALYRLRSVRCRWFTVAWLCCLAALSCSGKGKGKEASVEPPRPSVDVDEMGCDGGCDAATGVVEAGCPGAMCEVAQDCAPDTADCLSEVSSGVDMDGDGHFSQLSGGDDCDDQDSYRYPGNQEICDPAGHDEDCDPSTLGNDQDDDGYVGIACCNEGADGVLRCGDDCDDKLAGINPGTPESCTGLDEDCDGAVDEGVMSRFYRDCDGDGFGVPEGSVLGCERPAVSAAGCGSDAGIWADNPRDCDDQSAARNPGQGELCDDIPDNDCDPTTTGAFDHDGDGFEQEACGGSDCDDDNVAVHAGADELCDGIDNNCDGIAEGEDSDGDGFLAIDTPCSRGKWGHLPRTDCDDKVPSTHPGHVELCNAVDDDCDGRIDEGATESDCPVAPNAKIACIAGECTLAECLDPNEADCDGNLDNGCESDLRTSRPHCGSCGNRCGLGCEAGICDDAVEVRVGESSACIVLQSGHVACWGGNQAGQLGYLGDDVRAVQTRVAGLEEVKHVAVGAQHACAVLSSGAVSCWGDNRGGQLGDGLSSHTSCAAGDCSPDAVDVLEIDHAVGIDAAGDSTCVVLEDGLVRCWGDNKSGQLGQPGVAPWPTATPPLALPPTAQVSLGPKHACARTRDGSLYCWGANDDGQLGVDLVNGRPPCEAASEPCVLEPMPVIGVQSVADIAAGGSHTCALVDGAAVCWGSQQHAELGPEPGPGKHVVLSQAAAVGAGNGFSCAIDSQAGEVECWGANQWQQLARSISASTPDPDTILVGAATTSVRQLSVGADTACAVTTAGQVICWGRNDLGQTGDGTQFTDNIADPIRWSAALCDPEKSPGCMVSREFLTCAPRAEAFECISNTGTLSEREPCSSHSECFPGLVCVNSTGVPRCHHYCIVDDAENQPCRTEQVCQGLEIPSNKRVGVCVPPSDAL